MEIPMIGWAVIAIVVFYLLVSVVLSKQITTLEDYWVMGRKAKWYMFAGTLCCSYVSMWTFVAGIGLAWAWGPLPPILFYISSLTFGWIIATVLIGLRLRKLEYVSLSQYFQDRFAGQKGILGGISLALAGTLYFYLLIQIQGGAIIFSTVFPGISLPLGVILMIALVVVTLWLAGMWSVVITDTFTMLIFILTLILIVPGTIQTLGSVEAGLEALSEAGRFSATGASGLDMGYFAGFSLAWLAIIGGAPHLINRALVVESNKAVIKGAYVAYFITIVLTIFLYTFGGMLVGVIEPGSIHTDDVTPYAAAYHWPLYLGVVMIAGAMGAAFTTANTQAMTVSVGLVDVFKLSAPKKEGTDEDAEYRKFRTQTRIFAIVILIAVGLLAASRVWILAIASSMAGIIASLGILPTIILSLYFTKINATATKIMLWLSVPLGAFMIITNYFWDWFAPFPTIYSYPIGFGGLIILSLLTKQTEEEREAANRVFDRAFIAEPVAKEKDDNIYLIGIAVLAVIVFIYMLYLVGLI